MDKIFGETLAFMWNSACAPREKFKFYFSGVFTSTDKIFILEGRLGYNSMKFWDFVDIFEIFWLIS